MPARAPVLPARSSRRYAEKRDFDRTPEPPPARIRGRAAASAPLSFVVQKHAARRLHWDFRLEHDGVLWSWAVPRGPSLDPADKRLAVHVEDHPLDYRDFEGTIPDGNYGAGRVEIWDRGTWQPLGDAAEGLSRGEIKFDLAGGRLRGRFVLIRMQPRPNEHAENWLLIKERDGSVETGADAATLERRAPVLAPTSARKAATAGKPLSVRKAAPAGTPPPAHTTAPAAKTRPTQQAASARTLPPARTTAPNATTRPTRKAAPARTSPPARTTAPAGSPLPDRVEPALATLVETAPSGRNWVSEIKFDGYRILVRKDGDDVRLSTRNGLDWTSRLPTLARAAGTLAARTAMLDGELVALGRDGVTSFAALQAALSDGRDDRLCFYAFDLLHLDGADLRPRPLLERKAALEPLCADAATIRFSAHLSADAKRIRERACRLGLEGVICKRADSPYRSGRGTDWLKVKCEHRDEMIVLGATRPKGTRRGLGSIHLGYHARDGRLWYAGGCGSGFSDAALGRLAADLETLRAKRPSGLVMPEDPPAGLAWVRPERVVEIRHAGFTGGGLLRHARFLGLREDKPASDVVRDPPTLAVAPSEGAAMPNLTAPRDPAAIPAAEPVPAATRRRRTGAASPGAKGGRDETVAGVRLSHPGRALWPGVTKRDLAAYWHAVAGAALGGIAHRPLALLRCPDGIGGESFFQKHATRGFPPAIQEGACDGAPYLAIDDEAGLVSLAQMSAIELHSWGSSLNDPGHADRLVFDLDPGEGVGFAAVVAAATDLRHALEALDLAPFVRTSGGNGLHLVVPLSPDADWDTVRAWCRAFSVACERREPARFVASTTRKQARRGRILIDWLRNGLGATAIASFSPRARDGATVATPISWRDVNARLDPSAYTVATIPALLARRKRDAWDGFEQHAARRLPPLAEDR